MRRMAKLSVLSAFVIVLSGIYSSTTASAGTSLTGLILQSTAIDAGYYGSSGLRVPGNQSTALGKPLAVTCPGPHGTCVIEADLFIQVGISDTTRNMYTLCLYVDGNSAPNCQFVGSTPSDLSYTNGSTSQLLTGVAPGAHVVQAFILSNKGTSLFNYTFNYRVYK
jgi:hypothetical protein